MISYTETPIVEIREESIKEGGLRLLIKREDLNHKHISGNKWWKLKYNLARAQELGHETLLTFGGAYSNHLYAVAAAARELGMNSIGIVRGEETQPLNPTLNFVTQQGMVLHYLARAQYREKSGEAVLQDLQNRFGSFYLIPEGGTNDAAIRGCCELGYMLQAEASFDYLCLPVGTGGTLAGLVKQLRPQQEAIGISVLRNGGFLVGEVLRWLPPDHPARWRIETRFDFGGYAKSTPELKSFIERMRANHQLPLDPVYTGKAMFALFAMMEAGYFRSGSTVLMIHTGGLQGSFLTE